MCFKEKKMACVDKNDILKLEKALQEQGFKLATLHQFKETSQERIEYLTKFFNNESEAKFFNSRFESVLLEEQKYKLHNWVERAKDKGLKADSAKDLFQKIGSLKKAINVKEDKKLMNGLVQQKLGFMIDKEYAQKVCDAYNNYENSLAKLKKHNPEYMNLSGEQTDKMLSEQIQAGSGDVYEYALNAVKLKEMYDAAKLKADEKKKTSTKIGKVLYKVEKFAGFLRSAKATLDFSGARQLSTGAVTSKEFFAEAKKAYAHAWKNAKLAFKDPETAKMLTDMYILARPNAINGNYKKLGIEVGLREEAFPESFLTRSKDGKTAGWQKLFIASETGYAGMLKMARANDADRLLADKNNNIQSLKAQGAGDFINQITGRGKVHIKWNGEQQDLINVMLFAPKYLASRIRTLTDLQYVVTGKTQTEKMRAKTALNNALYFVLMPMLIKAFMRAIDEDDPHGEDAVERFFSALDPRSSDFGKLRVGETRLDTTFGLASIITAVSRIATGTTVSTKGQEKDTSWGDVLSSFFEGKMSPMGHFIMNAREVSVKGGRSLLFGEEFAPKDFMGRPMDWKTATDIVLPIFAQNIVELIDEGLSGKIAKEDIIPAAVGLVFDFFGLSTSTYSIQDRDFGKSKEFMQAEQSLAWNINRATSDIRPSKTSSIMTKLSGARQEKAVADFKKELNSRATSLVKSARFARMTDEDKAKALKKVREEVNKDIKKKYGIK